MKKFALACAAVAALGGIAFWWASSEPAPTATSASDGAARGWVGHPGATGRHTGSAPNALGDNPQASRSGGDPFLSADLRFLLEGLLLEAGEAGSPTELKQRLAALVPRHFPAAFVVRAQALAERYVDYRVALGALKGPLDPRDPQAVRQAMEARQQVRERHFSAEEFEALFGQDLALDRYTVARLEIERNAQLSPAQQALALREAELAFTPEQRIQRAQASAHVVVAAETASFDARATSEAERFDQRRQQHGEAAAQRLAQMDQEERHWQGRLALYAAALTQAAPPAELGDLRNRLFTESEQLRLEGALAARAQLSTKSR